jgi:hypothetical protein
VSGAGGRTNYTLAPTAVTTGTISAASLTATVTVAPKTYDGTLSATVTACTLSGVVSGDDVHCTGGTAALRSASAGSGKPVTVSG